MRVQPQDIDDVLFGQKAVLRLPAFNTCATPEIDGEVTWVSADVTHDTETGQSYDTARIRMREDQRECLKGLRLFLDMRGESFTQIGECFRSFLSHAPSNRLDRKLDGLTPQAFTDQPVMARTFASAVDDTQGADRGQPTTSRNERWEKCSKTTDWKSGNLAHSRSRPDMWHLCGVLPSSRGQGVRQACRNHMRASDRWGM